MSSCAVPAGSPADGAGARWPPSTHRPVPARAPSREGPQRPGPSASQAGLGVDRAALPGCGRCSTGGVRADRARPRVHCPAVPRHSGRSLRASGVTPIFAEEISTRAATPARAPQGRRPGPGNPRVWGRGHDRRARAQAARPRHRAAALAEQLRAADIGLEFLTGELQGSHAPDGVAFTVLAALSGMEREYFRPPPRSPRVGPCPGQGHRRRRRHRRRHARRRPAPALAGAQPAGYRRPARHLHRKEKGQHPSPATVMRMLRDHDEIASVNLTVI